MHWKGLRIGASDKHDSKGPSVVDPRHSVQLSRPTLSTTEVPSRRSETAPQAPLVTIPDENTQTATPGGYTANVSKMEPPSLPHAGSASSRRNRFSFMKLRHASDPQLSRSYAKGEQDAPPVPSLPPRKYFVVCRDAVTDTT